MRRFLRPGWLLIYAILLLRFLFSKLGGFASGSLDELNTTISVQEGETLNDVFKQVSSGVTTYKLKRFLKKNPESIETLQPGSYIFSGDYTFEEFFTFLETGPQVSYVTVTLLEGWSIYDIDAALARKEYIYEGEYVEFVNNELLISKYVNRYDFLEQAQDSGNLATMEGFLYPETYFIDRDKNFLDQLVFLQLEGFRTKVWEAHQEDIVTFQNSLTQKGYDIDLNRYEMMILASVIEKEERNDDNKDDIASVFLNRINDDMRIDADITLCYGLKEPYDACPPKVIVENLTDDANPYNTRAVSGLPPTPIANIHVNSLKGLLDSKFSDNYFYLHDPKGNIHLGKDLSEHNKNKSKYLN